MREVCRGCGSKIIHTNEYGTHTPECYLYVSAELKLTNDMNKNMSVDVDRYRLVRDHIAPKYLEGQGFENLGDIPKDEMISERIDRMIDARLAKEKGRDEERLRADSVSSIRS